MSVQKQVLPNRFARRWLNCVDIARKGNIARKSNDRELLWNTNLGIPICR
jgi:hypothetical protein